MRRALPRRSTLPLLFLFSVAVVLILCGSIFVFRPKPVSDQLVQILPIIVETTTAEPLLGDNDDFENESVLQGQLNTVDSDPMSKFVVGFPLNPMSLADLHLCDEKRTIILQGSYSCKEDSSCLACVKPSEANRFRDLLGAFRNKQVEAKRKLELSQAFAGQKTIVMFTFNFAHSDLFLNWACSAEKLGLDVKKFTLVVPCDEKSTLLVRGMGFTVLNPEWQDLLGDRKIHSHESFWGQDHADINNVALFVMNDLIDLGYQVFVHDADVAWIRNPLPFFESAIRRRDFLGMLAPFWTSMGPVNTGLLFISPTLQSRVFLKSMENAAIVKGTSDQRLWNTVLRHFAFQQLEWRLLPQDVVYKYSGSGAKLPGDTTLLMHAVGSNKREKLARFNLWLLNKECTFYDEEVDGMNAKERENAIITKK